MALTKIFDMSYEVDGDQVTIEQDMGCGEVNSVVLHSIHLRLLAGEMGLFRGDPDGWRSVESLSRKLLLLKERCAHLEEWLYRHSDTEHADLSYEQTFAEATADLAREFCRELPQYVRIESGQEPDKTQTEPTANPRKTHGVSAQAGLPLEEDAR